MMLHPFQLVQGRKIDPKNGLPKRMKIQGEEEKGKINALWI